jgi:hypothetical protein
MIMRGRMRNHLADCIDTGCDSPFGAIRRQCRRTQLGDVERPRGRRIVHQPYGGLRSVADPDLAKDRLDVDLHGPFCDTHLTGYNFVRIALADIPQEVFFARRERRQVERIGRRWSVRVYFQAAHVHRVLGRIGRVADIRKQFGRQDRLTEHHQFQGLDEGVGRHDFEEVGVGPGPESGQHRRKNILVGKHCDTAGVVLILEGLDLVGHRPRIAARIDYQQKGLVLLYRSQNQIVDAGCGRDDPKPGLGRAKDVGEPFTQQGTLSNKNGSTCTTTHSLSLCPCCPLCPFSTILLRPENSSFRCTS